MFCRRSCAAPLRVAQALNLLAKQRNRDPKVWAVYVDAAQSLAATATPSEVAIILNALARSSGRATTCAKAFYERSLVLFPSMSVRACAMIANAVVKLDIGDRAFFNKLTEELSSMGKLQKGNRRDLANLANAYARAGIPDKVFFDFYLHKMVMRDAEKFKVKDLVQVLNAYAKLELRNVDVFTALRKQVHAQLPHMDGMALSVIANAYQKVRLADVQLVDALASRLLSCANSCSAQAVAMLLHAFSKEKERPSMDSALRCLLGEFVRTKDEMDARGLILCAQAVRRSKYLRQETNMVQTLAGMANAMDLTAEQVALVLPALPIDLLNVDRLMPKICDMTAIGAANCLYSLGTKADDVVVNSTLQCMEIEPSGIAVKIFLEALVHTRRRVDYAFVPALLRFQYDLPDKDMQACALSLRLLGMDLGPDLENVVRGTCRRTPSVLGDLALSLPRRVVGSHPSCWGVAAGRHLSWENAGRAVTLHGELLLERSTEGQDSQVAAFVDFVRTDANDAKEMLASALMGRVTTRWTRDFRISALLSGGEVDVVREGAPKGLRRTLAKLRLKATTTAFEHGPYIIPLGMLSQDNVPIAIVEDDGTYEVDIRCGLLAKHGWKVLCVPNTWRDNTLWTTLL